MICKEAWLKVHRITNNQMKDESLYIWTQIAIWNESSFNISCQSVMILERQSDWQTNAATTTHDC